MATDVARRIDRGAAAEHLARTIGSLGAVLGNRLVFPDMPVVGQHFGEAGRNVDERITIHVARFDQRYRRIGVFGEIACNDAAARARTNYDNVVGFLGHQCLSFFTPFVSFNQHS